MAKKTSGLILGYSRLHKIYGYSRKTIKRKITFCKTLTYGKRLNI